MKDTDNPYSELPDDRIEMLNEPLVTEEGFVNPACVNELEAAINAIKEPFERNLADIEWSTEAATTVTEILEVFAGNTVSIFRGRIPPGFETVFSYLRACLVKDDRLELKDKLLDFRYGTLSLCDINKLLWDILGEMPEFQRWNDPEKILPPYDWVDLSALLSNVCVSIRDKRRHDFAFDRKFEREWAARTEP